MYRAVTRKIEVTVTPRFVSERSSPSNGYYFWAYTIDIANLGPETVQLKTRHWRITDALGRLQEVKGPGVVGEEPMLKPGESFEYTSGVPLADAVRLHGRQLRHGDGGGRAFRYRDPGLLARLVLCRADDQLAISGRRQTTLEPVERLARQDGEHRAGLPRSPARLRPAVPAARRSRWCRSYRAVADG